MDADIRWFFDTVDNDGCSDSSSTALATPHHPPDAKVAESGCVGGWKTGTDAARNEPGGSISPLLATSICITCSISGSSDGGTAARGREIIVVRYADDFIVGFQHENNARRFLDALRERLGRAAPATSEKTRLIEFGRFAAKNRKRRGLGKPETFNFLGFTFICSKTRQDKFQIKRKSRRDRMRAKLKEVKNELRLAGMHQRNPSPRGNGWVQVVSGYFNYHAVPTNIRALVSIPPSCRQSLWRRSLTRRSDKCISTNF